MKKIIQYLSLISIVVACQPAEPVENVQSQIVRVEASLSTLVHLTTDSLWSIEERMKHYGVPGVSLAVIKDNKIIWTKTYGVMDRETKEPVTATTLFQAGSISKPVAAYGALKEVELGKINLDENVNTYLKSWQLPDNEFTAEKKVALKHILSHTGGLTVHGFLGYSPDLPVPTVVQVLNGETPANSAPIRVDKVPEVSFRYSGGGYTIMQQMLVDIEGKPYPDILQELVLGPLQMDHSTYSQPLTEPQLSMASTGYLPDGTQTKGKRHTYPEMAAAGLWTTAEDLAKFAIDVQLTAKGSGSKVLSKDMANRMLTPFVEDFNGLGLFINDYEGEIYFQHGGWDEGFSSQLMAHKDKGYGAVVLTNSNHPEFINELIRAVAITYDWDNYVPTYTPRKMEAATQQKIVGRYYYDNDDVAIVYMEGDRAFLKYLRFEPLEFFQVTDSTFIRREKDATIYFEENPDDGKVYLTFLNEEGGDKFEHERMPEGVKVPYEWLMEGELQKAIAAYKKLQVADPADPALAEGRINRQGYDLLGQGKTQMAVDNFKVNIALYPKSANVYDSYAEACMKNGDTAEAIKNYKKTLTMNPVNDNAREMLKEMEGKK